MRAQRVSLKGEVHKAGLKGISRSKKNDSVNCQTAVASPPKGDQLLRHQFATAKEKQQGINLSEGNVAAAREAV